jgi:hypothetical protein
MAAIWRNDGTGWRLLAPTGFPDEKTLHDLVEQTPQILPLAGAPRLVVVGREVLLGNGYVDLVAVETSGRLAIIEIKLSRNADARRAVVAQILAYAAYLKGLDAAMLDQEVLGEHLRKKGYGSLEEAVVAEGQEEFFDGAAFSEGVKQSLAEGLFRLVIVLDEAPEELVRLVGYLESITDGLLIDLVTVSAYGVGESEVLVPQRVEPEYAKAAITAPSSRPGSEPHRVEGAQDFVASMDEAREHKPELRRLTDWAVSLEREGLARLRTTHGKGRWVLVPRLLDEDVSLAKVWNEHGAYLQLSRTVFERRAPESLPIIEEILAPTPVGQGNTTQEVSDELLGALTAAYREAASGKIG